MMDIHHPRPDRPLYPAGNYHAGGPWHLAGAGLDQLIDCLRWLYLESGPQISSRAGTDLADGADGRDRIGDCHV